MEKRILPIKKAALIFFVFACGYFLSCLLRAITATLSPVLTNEFNLLAGDLGLLAGGYFLGFASMQIPLGYLLDRHGPKKIVSAFLLIAIVGTASFALAENFTGLLVSRILIGIGVSACLMGPLTGYRIWFADEYQQRSNSWMLMIASTGFVFSTLPVQILLPVIGWRWIFGGVTFLILIVIILTLLFIPEWKNENENENDKNNLSQKNKIELKIEDYKLEIDEITKKIPEEWESKNKEFEILQKAKNTQTKRYKKNVDEAYDNLNQILMFIQDYQKLIELSSEVNNLKKNVESEDYEKSISNIDNLFEKLSEISGTEEFANRLDDLYSLIDAEEREKDKISNTSSEVSKLFDKEIKWRKDAEQNLIPELEKYNSVIKNNIGLRLQSRLTKEQAKFVASCNSVHRDISLNF